MKALKGKDWKVEIFDSGAQCWIFSENANEKRIKKCIDEINEKLMKEGE